jgi:H+-translocating NAD(P) transhydrogenase subunit beta
MSGFTGYIQLVYVLTAALFVVGLHLMNSPVTARRGNQVALTGMVIAVIATFILLIHDGTVTAAGWAVLICGALIGSGVGLYAARTVQMTAMPQLVSAFNSVGGGAAALVAIYGYIESESHAGGVLGTTTVFTVLDVLIGSVTFSGSIVAAGKLQGFIPSQPLVFKGGRLVNVALAVIAVGTGAFLFSTASLPAMLVLVLAALAFGVMMVLPIGGADMPVVISLLNAFTGLSAAAAGIALDNIAMIVAGMIVGASGSILTKLMADAMNRSIPAIVAGGFGGGASQAAGGEDLGERSVHSVTPDDAAIQLSYANRVVIVPGYGMAVAQAQHVVRELARELEVRGVDVAFAIHPVAGRMPGHMNVLLAEADVPYDQLKEMQDINPQFPQTDVALVIGANDVTNPAARDVPESPIYGMPILDVDKALRVIVLKRSMSSGFAGIDNPLFYKDNTSMLFGDAKQSIQEITQEVKQLGSPVAAG